MIGAAEGARAEGYDVFYVLEGAGGIDGWKRAGVGREGKLGQGVGVSHGDRGLRGHGDCIFIVVAGDEGRCKPEQQKWKRNYLHQKHHPRNQP
jgi:hypothetical protein